MQFILKMIQTEYTIAIMLAVKTDLCGSSYLGFNHITLTREQCRVVLPFHVHNPSHLPGACAVCDTLYGLPLHWYTTASYTVSVENKRKQAFESNIFPHKVTTPSVQKADFTGPFRKSSKFFYTGACISHIDRTLCRVQSLNCTVWCDACVTDFMDSAAARKPDSNSYNHLGSCSQHRGDYPHMTLKVPRQQPQSNERGARPQLAGELFPLHSHPPLRMFNSVFSPRQLVKAEQN